MRVLFKLLWKYHFFILFVLLEFIAFTLVVQNNKYHRAGFINSANSMAGGVYGTFNDILGYFSLKSTNDVLAEENAMLRSLLRSSYRKGSQIEVVVDDTVYHQQYVYQHARVISNSVTRQSNYLTLSIGSDHGVGNEMGVISSKGVIGIVKDVSDNYSAVMSLLHQDMQLGVKLRRTNYFGYVVWDGSDPEHVTMVDVPLPAEIKIGDTIVTSGASAIFPEGVLVGTVAEHMVRPGDNFYTVKVWLSANFSNLSYVYIVKNLMQKEQQTLEEAVQDENDN